MASKNALKQYIDLQAEIEETRERIRKTEKQIAKLEKDGLVTDIVSGGEGGIQHFKIEGFPDVEHGKLKARLYMRKAILQELENDIVDKLGEVDEFIRQIQDSHIRRIISFRFIDGMTWNMVADNMGGGNTEDSVRKTFERFMEKS